MELCKLKTQKQFLLYICKDDGRLWQTSSPLLQETPGDGASQLSLQSFVYVNFFFLFRFLWFLLISLTSSYLTPLIMYSIHLSQSFSCKKCSVIDTKIQLYLKQELYVRKSLV